MTETFLHYLFDSGKLGQSFTTVDGQNLEILKFGALNKSSGPDFLEAQTIYDNKRWAGHIEFHLNSSDWNRHGHQHDAAYGNVIAHFVLNHDKEIYINDFKLPVIELKEQIIPADFDKYQRFMSAKHWITCDNNIQQVQSSVIQEQIDLAFENRMLRKIDEVHKLLEQHSGNSKKVLFILLAKCLGGRHNSIPMEKLVLMVDFQFLARLNFSASRTVSYLKTLAGFEDSMANNTLMKAACKTPMKKSEWKTFGMRPQSQPKYRIAQLGELLSKINDLTDVSLAQLGPFLDLSSDRELSATIKDRITINAISPFLAAKGDSAVTHILKYIKPEQNTITDKWRRLGVLARSAKDSQGLIEQKNEFCNRKKCLFCKIGLELLKK